MNLPALEIPEDDALLAPWLERQLVGMDLGDLATQLALWQEDAAPPDGSSLDVAIGDRLATVLEAGLCGLSVDDLRGLLARPGLLLELQARIFGEGGDYWRGVAISSEHRAAVQRVESAVSERLRERPTLPPVAEPVGNLRARWRVLPAIAAVLLLALGAWALRPGPVPAPGWGFDRPGLLTQQIPADQYLTMLSQAANQWFNKKPDSADSLRARLIQFRDGCDTLLAAPHAQLAAADKEWLLKRCRAWRDGIEIRLAELDAGEFDIAEVRRRADELVEKAVDALHQRAESLG
ncbi:hypothetical protein [Lacipirellula limnantheis]|uniref:Uncharacterized protein n=1 Tax=Lacipirellula limnantheis TaxID=2528024 RepID=A0A517TTM0_9BACT|nr:hypothetical protein [Lacipirellula limnantheis]QDT71724.1 hypothetical protein I41_08840 [Lacipirellula limnantheis]